MSRQLDEALIALWKSVLDEGEPAALLVRHAERYAVTDLATHHKVLLTDAGQQAARKSGEVVRRLIGDDRGLVYVHSPIERCGQTARALQDGAQSAAGADVFKGVVSDLGATYLRDPAKVAAAYLTDGKAFVRAWFDGAVDKDVIAPCADVAALQLAAMADVLRTHAAVVAVTHDWNIAALREHALGARFEDVGWPQFLDGVVVRADGRVLCLTAPGASSPMVG